MDPIGDDPDPSLKKTRIRPTTKYRSGSYMILEYGSGSDLIPEYGSGSNLFINTDPIPELGKKKIQDQP